MNGVKVLSGSRPVSELRRARQSMEKHAHSAFKQPDSVFAFLDQSQLVGWSSETVGSYLRQFCKPRAKTDLARVI